LAFKIRTSTFVFLFDYFLTRRTRDQFGYGTRALNAFVFGRATAFGACGERRNSGFLASTAFGLIDFGTRNGHFSLIAVSARNKVINRATLAFNGIDRGEKTFISFRRLRTRFDNISNSAFVAVLFTNVSQAQVVFVNNSLTNS
jgi:hypothetical protein